MSGTIQIIYRQYRSYKNFQLSTVKLSIKQTFVQRDKVSTSRKWHQNKIMQCLYISLFMDENSIFFLGQSSKKLLAKKLLMIMMRNLLILCLRNLERLWYVNSNFITIVCNQGFIFCYYFQSYFSNVEGIPSIIY